MAGLISPLKTGQASQTDQTSEVSEAGAHGQVPGSPPEPVARAAGEPGADDIAAIRALVLKAHPDVGPEVITGSTVAALLSSIEPAQAAYGRLVEAVGSGWGPAASTPASPSSSSAPAAPFVPAGGSVPVPVDPDRLPPAEKIRRGLRV